MKLQLLNSWDLIINVYSTLCWDLIINVYINLYKVLHKVFSTLCDRNRSQQSKTDFISHLTSVWIRLFSWNRSSSSLTMRSSSRRNRRRTRDSRSSCESTAYRQIYKCFMLSSLCILLRCLSLVILSLLNEKKEQAKEDLKGLEETVVSGNTQHSWDHVWVPAPVVY